MKTIKTTLFTMKTTARLLCVITLLTLVSCGESSKNLEKGTPVAFSKAGIQAMQADKEANNGKRFSIEGYLSYSPGFDVYVNRPQTVSVKQALNSNDYQNDIAISMPWKKDGKNSVYHPQTADKGEPVFYDNEGKPLTQKDKVIVSFSLNDTDVFPTDIRLDKAQ